MGRCCAQAWVWLGSPDQVFQYSEEGGPRGQPSDKVCCHCCSTIPDAWLVLPTRQLRDIWYIYRPAESHSWVVTGTLLQYRVRIV